MTATVTPTKETHDSRSLILKVALELFTRQGYDGTSIDDVRQAAGFKSKASLYTHFKSKEELVRALLDHWLGVEEEVMLAAYQSAAPEPLDRFLKMGRAFIEWALTHPREYIFCFMRVQQEKLMRGEYDYLSGARSSPSYSLMLNSIEQLRAGYPVRAIDSQALLSMIVGMVSKAVLDQNSFGPLNLEQRADQIEEMSFGILFSQPVHYRG
jgi:AcrR family transcriptional regulator